MYGDIIRIHKTVYERWLHVKNYKQGHSVEL